MSKAQQNISEFCSDNQATPLNYFYFSLQPYTTDQCSEEFCDDSKTDIFCIAKKFGYHIEILDDHQPLENFPFHLF